MRRILIWFSAVFFLGGAGRLVAGAEDDPAPPPNRPNREEFKERARMLPPAERQKMIQEFREQHRLGATNGADWEKRREELKNLPPPEREAKMKELRRPLLQGAPGPNTLSPQEREAKRKELKERIDAQVSELEKKKADGTITEVEQRRLERMQQMSRRLEAGGPSGPRPSSPADARPEKLPPPAGR